MSKVIVVSEKGKLVGTSIPLQQPPQPGAPVTRLVAGPGQDLHEVEFQDAELFQRRSKSEDLTKIVKERLKLK
jgi:hypothetical protein